MGAGRRLFPCDRRWLGYPRCFGPPVLFSAAGVVLAAPLPCSCPRLAELFPSRTCSRSLSFLCLAGCVSGGCAHMASSRAARKPARAQTLGAKSRLATLSRGAQMA